MPRTLLVLDDSATIQEAVRQALTGEDWSVATASDTEGALDLLRFRAPDAVLCDMSLREVDGYEACRTIRATSEGADVPVILMGPNVNESAAVSAGASSILTKPFDSHDLLETLNTAIEQGSFALDLGGFEAADEQVQLLEEVDTGPEGPSSELEEAVEIVDLSDDEGFEELELLEDLEPIPPPQEPEGLGESVPPTSDVSAPAPFSSLDLPAAGPEAEAEAPEEESFATADELELESTLEAFTPEGSAGEEVVDWAGGVADLGSLDLEGESLGKPEAPTELEVAPAVSGDLEGEPLIIDAKELVDETEEQVPATPSEGELDELPQEALSAGEQEELEEAIHTEGETPLQEAVFEEFEEQLVEPAEAVPEISEPLEAAEEEAALYGKTAPGAESSFALPEEKPAEPGEEPGAGTIGEPGEPSETLEEPVALGEEGASWTAVAPGLELGAETMGAAQEIVPESPESYEEETLDPSWAHPEPTAPPGPSWDEGTPEPEALDLSATVDRTVREALQSSLSPERLTPVVEAVVERVVWEVVPQLAERLIQETIDKLQKKPPSGG